MLIYRKTGDVWWPKLSADGRFVAFGGGGLPDAPPSVRVVHLASGQEIPLGRGRAIHWIGTNDVTWLVDLGGNRAERWHATIVTQDGTPFAMNVSKTPDDPAIVAGNEFAASNGHWASWLDEGKRLVYDGRVLSHKARKLAMAGDYLLYIEDDSHFVRVWNGTLSVRLPLPARANSFTISPGGTIGYGYYWPTRIINTQGVDLDITVTPWRQESVPWIVAATGHDAPWAWTATVRPSDGVGLVLGRPIGALDCIILEGFPAVALDSVINDRDFLVAGCDDTGHLQVHRLPIETPRRLVTDGVTQPPPPPPPPEPPKETPVKLEQKYIDTIFQFTAKFPCPGHNEDDLREHWTPRLIEQLTFSHPRAGFGWKARDRNAPPSSDVICIRSGGHTLGWDIIPNAGTSGWTLNPAAAESINLDDQYFFELPAENHLGTRTPEEPEEPEEPGEPPRPPTDLAPIIREFDETQNALTQLVMAVTMVGDAMNRVGDVMERIERHDLVIANEIRIATAAITDLRKRLDSSIKVRL